MAAKDELLAWQTLAIPVLIDQQVVPVAPFIVKFVTQMNPLNNSGAVILQSQLLDMLRPYEAVRVTSTPWNYRLTPAITTLYQLFHTLKVVGGVELVADTLLTPDTEMGDFN